jgi:hypothetical protein
VKKKPNDRTCQGSLGHRFAVKGTFWQNVVGFIHLEGRCLNCKGKFIVPVVRDMDREVIASTARVRVSRPTRRQHAPKGKR